MMTPFDFPIISESDDLKSFGRRSHIKVLDTALKTNPIQNVFFHSPSGTGKTTLLNRFFSAEKKAELLERGVLVQFCYFTGSQMRSDADVYVRLIDAVTSGLEQINNQTERHKKISKDFQAAMANYDNYEVDENKGGALLLHMLNTLAQEGLHIVLVFDNFQSLTCSECCSVHAFNYMSSLAQEHVCTFIVASDFHSKVASKAYGLSDFERVFDLRPDLEGISPKKNKESARILQDRIREMMRSFQEDEGTESSEMIEISDQEMEWLFEDTAGIPGLLQEGMKAYYTERKEGWSGGDRESFDRIIYSGCKSELLYWTKYFNHDYWTALNDIYRNRSLDSEETFSTGEEKWKGLVDSRLVISASAYGEFRFICPLFERYLAKNLQRHLKDTAPVPAQNGERDVFLSYKHKTDELRVEALDDFLTTNRISTFSDKDLPATSYPDYYTTLIETLGKAKHFIVLISDYRLITADTLELAGDWVNLEMCNFKKLLDEGKKPGGKFILLLADEIYDSMMKTEKRDLNSLWYFNTVFLPWRDYKSKLIQELR
ncbi:MAG: AAA family ATPase [Clostridia bacterium]|nr:AAA family ATPase [Clostridia bacterium]